MAIWHPFIRGYREMRARYRVRREEKRLAGMTESFFSRDHVGFKIEIWKEHLSEFAGRDGLRMLEIGSYEGRSAIWFSANVLFDAVFAWPRLKPGGMMIFDDYDWRPDLHPAERPKPSIDRFMELFADQMRVVEMGFQVVLRRK